MKNGEDYQAGYQAFVSTSKGVQPLQYTPLSSDAAWDYQCGWNAAERKYKEMLDRCLPSL